MHMSFSFLSCSCKVHVTTELIYSHWYLHIGWVSKPAWNSSIDTVSTLVFKSVVNLQRGMESQIFSARFRNFLQ